MSVIFHSGQSKISTSRKRFRVVCCGRRFGKTLLAIWEMAGKAYAKKNRTVAYIAPTYQQARDIAWVQLLEALRPVTLKVNETRLEVTVQTQDKGKSIISLRGWENIETMRGQAFDFVVLDEVASMKNFDSTWRTTILPTLTDRIGEAIFVSTPKGFNHFYDLFNMAMDKKKNADWESFHFTSYDNPHLPKGELDNMRKQMSEDQFAQEYLADFRKSEGLVYKEFDRSRHLYTGDIPRRIEFFMAGVDFGFTNPACVLHIFKDSDNHYWIDEEMYRSGMTDARIADYVKEQRFNFVYPDPENAAAIKELEDRGVNVREVRKGKDSIVNGINRVRELLKQSRLHVNARCAHTIEEFESYHYPEDVNPDRNPREVPAKDNDHACFTKDAVIGMPMGEILSCVSMGKKPVYRWMGTKVTSEHPFLTQRGFVRFDALRYSDTIAIWTGRRLMELSLGDIQTLKGASLGIILSLLKRNLSVIRQNDFIGIYGKNILARFLQKCISITRMAIRLITIYLTSKWLLRKSTFDGIMTSISISGKPISNMLENSRLNGINQKRVVDFIKSWQNYHGTGIHTQSSSVRYADNHIAPLSREGQNSALIIASLEPCEPEEVFSVVTSSGFYSANGAVVSNCDALRYVIMSDDSIVMEDVDFGLYSTKYR